MDGEDKKPIKLIRMPDGSMRPATDAETDIGNVWATQSQIRAEEVRQSQLPKEEPKPKLSARKQKKADKAATKALKKQAPQPKAEPVGKPIIRTGVYRNQGDEPANNSPAPGQVVTPSQATPQEIAISITMPKVSLPKVPKKHVTHIKRSVKSLKSAPKWVYAAAVLIAIPAFIITLGVVSHNSGDNNKPSVQGESKAALPGFQPVTPNGDITNTTSQKVKYDPAKKVASYTDKINGFEVTVSMQSIPDTFKPAIGDNVKKVAEQFAATTVLPVDNGAAYLGTSPKGPQSFVGYRGDLLVFMKSQVKIDNQAWADYFNSLK